jgi:precorrin-6A/cobalt-precorrin-6A reductase
VDGLTHTLLEDRFRLLIDATHPFAAVMPHHAAEAARRAGVPRLRLWRRPWSPRPGDRWHDADDLDDAARQLSTRGAERVLVTTGRHHLAPFAGFAGIELTVRSIEALDPAALPGARTITDRGPYTVAGEIELLRSLAIDTIVTRNAGGTATAAKLEAARTLGVDVVMIRRPAPPAGPIVTSVAEALAWIERREPGPTDPIPHPTTRRV